MGNCKKPQNVNFDTKSERGGRFVSHIHKIPFSTKLDLYLRLFDWLGCVIPEILAPKGKTSSQRGLKISEVENRVRNLSILQIGELPRGRVVGGGGAEAFCWDVRAPILSQTRNGCKSFFMPRSEIIVRWIAWNFHLSPPGAYTRFGVTCSCFTKKKRSTDMTTNFQN